jgi:hypothetical protein
MRSSVKRTLGLSALGALAALAFAAWKLWSSRTRAVVGDAEWENAPFPFPPVPRPPRVDDSGQWAQPVDGACPSSHPVKAKISSGIYHVPGGMSYERTNADRCYVDTQAAETDGLRAAKM